MILQAVPALAFADPAPTPAAAPVPALGFAPVPAAPPAPAPENAMARSQYPRFLIGPGDMLSITVLGEKDLPTAYLVDSAGTIEFPLVGPVMLGSLTPLEASQALTSVLGKYLKDPQVTVLVTDSAQYTVSVMGNVVKPGKYLIRGLPTLLGALAQAGGPMANSDLKNVVLVRGDQTFKMPLDIYLEPHHIEQSQPLLYPGDILYVPTSPWPTFAEWAIIASLLSSAAVLADAVYSRP
jgi:polysaccharide export outer membrane protein